MKIAFEAPVKDTELALELGDYIFAIAPFLLTEQEYEGTVKSFSEKKELYIDNGAYENNLISGHALLGLCWKFRPKLVVAPDVIGDAKETIELTKVFLKRLRERLELVEVMGVIQGEDEGEKMWCLTELLKLGVNRIGLGQAAFFGNMTDRFTFARTHCVNCPAPLHLLGAKSVSELMLYKGLVDTIDSSFPFKYAQQGIELPAFRGGMTLDWHKPLGKSQRDLVVKNVEVIRDALR